MHVYMAIAAYPHCFRKTTRVEEKELFSTVVSVYFNFMDHIYTNTSATASLRTDNPSYFVCTQVLLILTCCRTRRMASLGIRQHKLLAKTVQNVVRCIAQVRNLVPHGVLGG